MFRVKETHIDNSSTKVQSIEQAHREKRKMNEMNIISRAMFVSMVENPFSLYACLVVIRLPINFQHTVCQLSTNLSELH